MNDIRISFIWSSAFYLLMISCKTHGQDTTNQWIQIQDNALSFKQKTTIYFLPGDFEGDYIFKIRPATDGFLYKDSIFRKLDIRKFAITVDLRKAPSGKLMIEKVTCRFLGLSDKLEYQIYTEAIEKYFSNLDFSIVDPDEYTRDFFSLNFMFLNK